MRLVFFHIKAFKTKFHWISFCWKIRFDWVEGHKLKKNFVWKWRKFWKNWKKLWFRISANLLPHFIFELEREDCTYWKKILYLWATWFYLSIIGLYQLISYTMGIVQLLKLLPKALDNPSQKNSHLYEIDNVSLLDWKSENYSIIEKPFYFDRFTNPSILVISADIMLRANKQHP